MLTFEQGFGAAGDEDRFVTRYAGVSADLFGEILGYPHLATIRIWLRGSAKWATNGDGLCNQLGYAAHRKTIPLFLNLSSYFAKKLGIQGLTFCPWFGRI